MGFLPKFKCSKFYMNEYNPAWQLIQFYSFSPLFSSVISVITIIFVPTDGLQMSFNLHLIGTIGTISVYTNWFLLFDGRFIVYHHNGNNCNVADFFKPMTLLQVISVNFTVKIIRKKKAYCFF